MADTDRATLIRHLLEGQYSSPVCVVAFNTAEGWSRDVTEDVAGELAQACADRDEISPSIADFITDHTRPSRVRLKNRQKRFVYKDHLFRENGSTSKGAPSCTPIFS